MYCNTNTHTQTHRKEMPATWLHKKVQSWGKRLNRKLFRNQTHSYNKVVEYCDLLLNTRSPKYVINHSSLNPYIPQSGAPVGTVVVNDAFKGVITCFPYSHYQHPCLLCSCADYLFAFYFTWMYICIFYFNEVNNYD